MDAIKSALGGAGNKDETKAPTTEQSTEQSSGGGGFMDKINSAAGGGRESEKNEDYLDKGNRASPLRLCDRED